MSDELEDVDLSGHSLYITHILYFIFLQYLHSNLLLKIHKAVVEIIWAILTFSPVKLWFPNLTLPNVPLPIVLPIYHIIIFILLTQHIMTHVFKLLLWLGILWWTQTTCACILLMLLLSWMAAPVAWLRWGLLSGAVASHILNILSDGFLASVGGLVAASRLVMILNDVLLICHIDFQEIDQL